MSLLKSSCGAIVHPRQAQALARSLRTLGCAFNAERTREGNVTMKPERRTRTPLCLYFTQNRCLYMDNKDHLEKFSHSYPPQSLALDPALLVNVRPQPFDHFLVLDLEGKVEILEFPVVLVNSNTLQVVDRFHRFVRPHQLKGERLQAYVSGKYGQWRLDNLWNDTAISFQETLNSFESWLKQHSILDSRGLQNAAFVTCGNWDIKTKIPQQCTTSGLALPEYFSQWINLKDVYLNFYNRKATGMLAMLKGLEMRSEGSHHLGLDDAHNITRVLQRLVCDGAVLSITARRMGGTVEFLYDNRV